jgi:hypothetical protein
MINKWRTNLDLAPSLAIPWLTNLDKAPGLKIVLRKNLDLAPKLKIDLRTNLEMAPRLLVATNVTIVQSHFIKPRISTSIRERSIQSSGRSRKNKSKRIDNPESSSAISVNNASRNHSIFMITEEITTLRSKFNWPNRTSETMSAKIVENEQPLKML